MLDSAVREVRANRGAALTPSRATRPAKASDLIVDWVRGQVARGELTMGSRLPSEAVLIEQFGVSKPTLREALRVLEADGLVEIVRGRAGGARITPPSTGPLAQAAGVLLQARGTSVGELYEVRLQLERGVPRLVCERPDLDDVLDRLDGLASFPSAANGRSRAVRVGHAFHTELVRLTGNRALIVFVEVLETITEAAGVARLRGAPAASPAAASLTHAFEEHGELVRLLRARAVNEAEDLWARHLVATRDAILDPDSLRRPAAVYGVAPRS